MHIREHMNIVGHLNLALVLIVCSLASPIHARCPNNYHDAFQAYDSGDHEFALSIFSCLTVEFERNIGNYINRGICYIRLDEFRKAFQDFDHALAIYQQDPFVNLQLPPYQELATRKNRTLQNFQYPIHVYPRSFIHYLKGEVYTNMGNYQQSIQEYSKAIAIYPLNKDAYVNRGLLYLIEGKLNAGYADLRNAANKGHSVAKLVLRQRNVFW